MKYYQSKINKVKKKKNRDTYELSRTNCKQNLCLLSQAKY